LSKDKLEFAIKGGVNMMELVILIARIVVIVLEGFLSTQTAVA